MEFIETIEQLDTALFLFLNSKHNSWMDVIMQGLSNRLLWIPFYALLLVMCIVWFKKRTFFIAVAVIVLIVASDQGSNVLKKSVKRYRPCHNELIQEQVLLVGKCGGNYGFVSAHAGNTVGLAMFLWLLLKHRNRWIPMLIFSWAFLVSYSRIYVGVHYPLDVLGGWMLGLAAAWGAYQLYNYLCERFLPQHDE